MKASVSSSTTTLTAPEPSGVGPAGPALGVAAEAAAASEKSLLSVLSDLVKARLNFLVLMTTAVGFYLGWRGGPVDLWLMTHALLGTALVAAGAAALNQLWEREEDSRMRRTAGRPLPSGRLQADTVLLLGGALVGVGLIYLALAVNVLTALLGAVTFGSYLFIYTPLKRVTWLNTAVGAVPGALPPLMGWTATTRMATCHLSRPWSREVAWGRQCDCIHSAGGHIAGGVGYDLRHSTEGLPSGV